MILLAVLAGLYAICGVGYFKLTMRVAGKHKDDSRVFNFILGLMSVGWPAMLVYTLTRSAVQ